jgi:hypothetical protein
MGLPLETETSLAASPTPIEAVADEEVAGQVLAPREQAAYVYMRNILRTRGLIPPDQGGDDEVIGFWLDPHEVRGVEHFFQLADDLNSTHDKRGYPELMWVEEGQQGPPGSRYVLVPSGVIDGEPPLSPEDQTVFVEAVAGFFAAHERYQQVWRTAVPSADEPLNRPSPNSSKSLIMA